MTDQTTAARLADAISLMAAVTINKTNAATLIAARDELRRLDAVVPPWVANILPSPLEPHEPLARCACCRAPAELLLVKLAGDTDESPRRHAVSCTGYVERPAGKDTECPLYPTRELFETARAAVTNWNDRMRRLRKLRRSNIAALSNASAGVG